MSRFTCYIQPGKAKSRRVLEAFAAGSGARLESTEAASLFPGVPVFYGVRPGWAHLWRQAKAEGRDWVFIDNAYFDVSRGTFFRVTRNAIQHSGRGTSDGRRFRALGLEIAPMRHEGDHVVVCAQSDEFMATVAGDPQWLARTLREMDGWRLIVRRKSEPRPLSEDLEGCTRLYTWSSAAAVTALLAGVPVACSPQCCAYDVPDRQKWAEVLADNQWTLDELAKGVMWRD